MAINKETTFTDAVTVVTAAWLNLLQEHLAGLATLKVDNPTATQVRIDAGSDGLVAAVYIGGKQRFRDTAVSFTFTSELANTYSVYVTAPAGVTSFNMSVTTGTPATTPYRKVAEVVWNGAAITSIRQTFGRNVQHTHSPLGGSGVVDHTEITGTTTGDPHTQYSPVSGSRAFTGVVAGITPTIDAHLATKGYIDGITVPGLPIGTILPFAGADTSLPSGWKMCDGTSYDTTAEAALFAVLGYAFGGAGANFNVPDLRQSLPLGKAAAGTGSTIGATGGTWAHSHTQPTHTHTGVAHTHATASHSHSIPTTGGPSVEHSHTQGSMVATGNHYHVAPYHYHFAGTLALGSFGSHSVGAPHASQASAGIYAASDLDNYSSSTSHIHSGGSLLSTSGYSAFGNSAYGSVSHYHPVAGNAYDHTHVPGAVSGNTGGPNNYPTAVTGYASSGDHSHTNPATSTTTEGHTHSGGTSGGGTPSMASGGGGSFAAGGDDALGTAQAPSLRMNYIVRAS
jgi:microcystin-dependent protein